MSIIASLDRRRIATAFVALFLAFGSGYLMQNILAPEDNVANMGTPPDAARLLREQEKSESLPVPPAATLVPIEIPAPKMPERVDETDDVWKESKADCQTTISVTPSSAAMLSLRVHAPCNQNQILRVTHEKLAFDSKTDKNGVLALQLPAMAEDAQVTVNVAGELHAASVHVDDANEFQRVAVIWDTPEALELHAFEFGARRNQFGHVWKGSSKSAERAVKGTGGFLVSLGDGSGKSAAVYTFPAHHISRSGVVRLQVETLVTKQNCGRPLAATALQSGVLGQLMETNVNLRMPGCDAIDQTVELKNLLHDMRLASR